MTTTIACLHRWTELSRHGTSEGVVIYERCHCGENRIVTATLVRSATTA
ncbi:hypothetical protein [Rhodococcoides corynebacterioides]|uniref:Uncharacterized protein n=1 Tax=Rhodococcoides corynebacterioides TaxID=53972 RepID=A0ABS7NZ52_9NOCA|nr:hypothetical protein [Rhodococcus corynebacterioides]MBY6348738.1 hypothetical protein [Rhodococcus corynebacterioides]MBY6361855.1 hypothetical protein [Rhodococcus corynebacterioides]MBY6365416.1 hypothetical protein [Rhodococcus corynebacterioides]MBY6407930.1 hypothetical protein [Rhodococcus corynebacterioides]